MMISIELMVFIMPEHFLKFISEIHVILKINCLLALEDSLGHLLSCSWEFLLIFFKEFMLLSKNCFFGIQIKCSLELFWSHISIFHLLETVLHDPRRYLQECDEIEELLECNCVTSIKIGEMHNTINFVLELTQVKFGIFWLLIIVWSQCLEEALIGHLLILTWWKISVNLCWSSKESDLVFLNTNFMFTLGWWLSQCCIGFLKIQVWSQCNTRKNEMGKIEFEILILLILITLPLLL